MNDVIRPNRKSRFTLLHGLFALIPLAILAELLIPAYDQARDRGNTTRGISNCRQIISALRAYSYDHDGKYPDAEFTVPRSSNGVFRALFKENVLDNELVFGCPVSPFVPDGNIGEDGDRSKALEAGENHWAMTRRLSDSAKGDIPLIYENPAEATWPPTWNVDAKGTLTRGRAWGSGIIIGMNDTSVSMQPLGSKKGTSVPLRKLKGQDYFEAAIGTRDFPQGEVLDVE